MNHSYRSKKITIASGGWISMTLWSPLYKSTRPPGPTTTTATATTTTTDTTTTTTDHCHKTTTTKRAPSPRDHHHVVGPPRRTTKGPRTTTTGIRENPPKRQPFSPNPSAPQNHPPPTTPDRTQTITAKAKNKPPKIRQNSGYKPYTISIKSL